MAQETTTQVSVGDDVIFIEKRMSGETNEVLAKVMEVRYILGKQTYVIEAENGKRRVVGESQISKI